MEDRLRAALKEAMKSRGAVARSAIRSALGAIDNAGSLGLDSPDLPGGSGRIAGGVQGLGAGDAPRRELDEGQIIEIVRAEVTSRQVAAKDYKDLGRLTRRIAFAPNATSWSACSRTILPGSHCPGGRGLVMGGAQ